MIYLNREVKSGLGEDTFWTWFEREFKDGCCFEVPKKLNDDDILLRYSTLGFLPIEGKQIAYCLELLPQMKELFGLDMWDEKLKKVNECARYSTYRVVATEESVKDYEKYGAVDVIPIGVDTEVYKPLNDKENLRKKYNLPLDKKIAAWIGTCHPMKGYDRLLQYAADNPDIHFIAIWKWEMEATRMEGASNFVQIPQVQINELLNAADFFISTSYLNSFYMAEWEAMASDIPFVLLGDNKREFIPQEHPRNDIFEKGWDRASCKKKWEKYFSERGVKW